MDNLKLAFEHALKDHKQGLPKFVNTFQLLYVYKQKKKNISCI